MNSLHSILLGKSHVKREVWRPKGIIKMDLTDIECEGMDLVRLPQGWIKWRGIVIHGNETSNTIKAGNMPILLPCHLTNYQFSPKIPVNDRLIRGCRADVI
jgi:hypothetical protein